VARRRPQFFLADLAAIIALCALGAALWVALPRRGSIGVIYLGIAFVIFTWSTIRQRREGPACEECGRRFVLRMKIGKPLLCPQCGHSQRPRTRTGRALVIGSRCVLALLVLFVLLIGFFPIEMGGPRGLPPRFDTLAIAVVVAVIFLTALLLGLVVPLLLSSTALPEAAPCKMCGTILRPYELGQPLVCPRCRRGHVREVQSINRR
jgi:predicted Zn-ribbon and HTH transcriptional regulator